MNIRDHKQEVIRWLNSPEETNVWYRCEDNDYVWLLSDNPFWDKDCDYIVDDRHAEIRKKWIDKCKPQVQRYGAHIPEWFDVEGDIPWDLNTDYRLKPMEWDTPKGEDPIAYHAKRLGNEGGNSYILKDKHHRYWIGSGANIPVGTVVMTKKIAIKICDALNSGELKLEDNNEKM